MKWNRVVILMMEPEDEVCIKMFIGYQARYSVPDHYCFAIRAKRGCTVVTPGCLSAITGFSTKLIIIGHGDWITVGKLGPRDMAVLLSSMGLERIGLIAFKSCSVGESVYLDFLAEWLERENIRVGWLIAYKEDAWLDIADDMIHMSVGGRYADKRLRLLGLPKRPDEMRVRIVQGNAAVVPPSGFSRRYLPLGHV